MDKLESITFLIGGKYSRQQQPEEIRTLDLAAINWYRPNPDSSVRNFYRYAYEVWNDVYGDNPLGTVGHPASINGRVTTEEFFYWENTDRPNYKNVTAAAEKLISRCVWVRDNHSPGSLSIRLVGHSAGCLVANRATHLADSEGLKIDELILCAPPVPRRKNDFLNGWSGAGSDPEIAKALPNLDALSDARFFYIPVPGDLVLILHGVGMRYDESRYIDADHPDVRDAAIAPDDLGLFDHWEPVSVAPWEDKYMQWLQSHRHA